MLGVHTGEIPLYMCFVKKKKHLKEIKNILVYGPLGDIYIYSYTQMKKLQTKVKP